MAEMDDPMLKCPYDDSHSILKSRMQFHLVKCRKNHIGSQKLRCPFDTLHVIDPLELDYHISVCETGASLVTQNYTLGSLPKTEIIPIESMQSQPLAAMTENWDEDSAPVASYDPEHHIETRNITRMLIGASKAKRKQFRQAERLRMQALNNISALPPVRKPAIDKKTEKPLRSPRLQRKVLADSKPNVGLDNIDISKLSISETSTTSDSKLNMGLDSIDISKLLINETPAVDNEKKISSKSSKNVIKDEHSTSKVTSDQSNVKHEGIISDSVQKSNFNNASTETTTSINPQMQSQVETEIKSSVQSDNESYMIQNIEECLSDASSSNMEPFVTTKNVTSNSENEIAFSTSKDPELEDDVLSFTSKDSCNSDFNNAQNLNRTEQKKQVPCFDKSDETNSSKIPDSKEDDALSEITSRLNSLSALAKFYANEKAKLDQKITEYVSSTSTSNLTDVLRKISLVSASSCNNPSSDSQTNVSGVNRRCAANFCVPDLTRPSVGRGITNAHHRISRPGAESTSSDTCLNFQRASKDKIEDDMKYDYNSNASVFEKSGRKFVDKDALLKNGVSITNDSLYEAKENLKINANSNDDTTYEASSVNNSADFGWSKVSSRRHKSTNSS